MLSAQSRSIAGSTPARQGKLVTAVPDKIARTDVHSYIGLPEFELPRWQYQPGAQHYPLLLIVARTMCRLRRKRVPCFEPLNRLLLLSLFLHSQPAGPFGRTFAVPVKLAVVAISLVRAAIAQLYATPLAYLVESLLRSVGSLNT